MAYLLTNAEKLECETTSGTIISLNKNLIINTNQTYAKATKAFKALVGMSNETFKTTIITEKKFLNEIENFNIDSKTWNTGIIPRAGEIIEHSFNFIGENISDIYTAKFEVADATSKNNLIPLLVSTNEDNKQITVSLYVKQQFGTLTTGNGTLTIYTAYGTKSIGILINYNRE